MHSSRSLILLSLAYTDKQLCQILVSILILEHLVGYFFPLWCFPFLQVSYDFHYFFYCFGFLFICFYSSYPYSGVVDSSSKCVFLPVPAFGVNCFYRASANTSIFPLVLFCIQFLTCTGIVHFIPFLLASVCIISQYIFSLSSSSSFVLFDHPADSTNYTIYVFVYEYSA